MGKRLDKDDVSGIFDEMFGTEEQQNHSTTEPKPHGTEDLQGHSTIAPQHHSPTDLRSPSTVEPWFYSDTDPQIHGATEPRSHSTTEPQHHGAVPNDCSWVGGSLKRRGVYLYEAQSRRLRHFVAAGQDIYGMGLNESVVARCALELLLQLGIQPHQGMTEEDLWQEVMKGVAKMNVPELMLYVEMALKRAGLSDRAEQVLSELHWLLDTCTPDEIRQISDE